jgi:hypothetical protein
MGQLLRKAQDFLVSKMGETVLRLLVVLSIILSFVASYQVTRLYRCQAAYSEASAAALRARDRASFDDRKATDDMVTSILSSTTGAETLKALQEYVATRTRTDLERSQNPLPVPGNFC